MLAQRCIDADKELWVAGENAGIKVLENIN